MDTYLICSHLQQGLYLRLSVASCLVNLWTFIHCLNVARWWLAEAVSSEFCRLALFKYSNWLVVEVLSLLCWLHWLCLSNFLLESLCFMASVDGGCWAVWVWFVRDVSNVDLAIVRIPKVYLFPADGIYLWRKRIVTIDDRLLIPTLFNYYNFNLTFREVNRFPGRDIIAVRFKQNHVIELQHWFAIIGAILLWVLLLFQRRCFWFFFNSLHPKWVSNGLRFWNKFSETNHHWLIDMLLCEYPPVRRDFQSLLRDWAHLRASYHFDFFWRRDSTLCYFRLGTQWRFKFLIRNGGLLKLCLDIQSLVRLLCLHLQFFWWCFRSPWQVFWRDPSSSWF